MEKNEWFAQIFCSKHIAKKLLVLFIILAACLSCAAADEQAVTVLGKLYEGANGLIVTEANNELALSDKIKCTVLETAMVGDQLIQVVRFEPLDEGVFLYPVDAMTPPDQKLAFTYLQAVIGDNFLMKGFAESDQGVALKAYLDIAKKTPYWIEFYLATQESAEDKRLQNRWFLQEDGSLISVASVVPVRSDTENVIDVYLTGYVADADGKLEKDGADAVKVSYSLRIDGANVNPAGALPDAEIPR